MSEPPDVYVHGHHESVLRSHTWRTAENSAAHLLPHLRAGMDVLDVGCGPGTITVELAERVAPGRVLGIDAAAEVIEQARTLPIPEGVECAFAVDDVYSLTHVDDSFDIVHCHQVLQHLTDPVAALREMRRVAKTDGLVSARDADYAGMVWAPSDPLLDRWLELYHELTRVNRVEADAGRHLLRWAREAGFGDVVVSSSTWTYATPQARQWWAGLWADRVRESNYAAQALEHALSTTAELDDIAHAWHRWANDPSGFFLVPHGEILCRVG